MLNTKTSENIEEMKDNFAKGYSLREIGFIVLGVCIMAGCIFFCTKVARLSIVTSVYICIPFALPVVLTGFVNINNMTLMEIIKTKLKNLFRKPLVYESTEYDAIMDLYKEEKAAEETAKKTAMKKQKQKKEKKQKKGKKNG